MVKSPLGFAPWLLNPGFSFTSSEFTLQVLQHHPYFGFNSPIITQADNEAEQRHFQGKEYLFYLIVLLLLIFGLLKRVFSKYFADLFNVFFRTSLKQRQIREQMEQTPVPSLLLNVFFIVSGGLYITFLLEHYALNPTGNFWLLFLLSCAGLMTIYFVKFIGLKVAGWLFSIKETADSYIFIVFIVNKMIGILLLPFLVILAFARENIFSAGLMISFILAGAMLFYRIILTYAAVRNQVKVNPFHFFLYLCAFEIAPLLLIYKGLLVFLGITA